MPDRLFRTLQAEGTGGNARCHYPLADMRAAPNRRSCVFRLALSLHRSYREVFLAEGLDDRRWSQGADRCPEHAGRLGTHTSPPEKPKPSPFSMFLLLEGLPRRKSVRCSSLSTSFQCEVGCAGRTHAGTHPAVDRRPIILKLEEVYGSEETGYRAKWNDDRVATDLNMDKRWVGSSPRGELRPRP